MIDEAMGSGRSAAKHTILYLAANPSGTTPLALGEEARAIQHELERSGYRDSFELETRWAVQPLDLLRELRKLKPTVVHFSGHGGARSADGTAGQRSSRHVQPSNRHVAAAPGPDPSNRHVAPAPGPDQPSNRHLAPAPGSGQPTAHGSQYGLCFQAPDGSVQVVTAQALEDTFGAAGSSVKLVVLSACYADAQAEALRAHIDCVVGMKGTVDDRAARNFAIGFYGGLGERESIAAAFRQGCAAISLEGLRDADRPQLKTRAGVDAERIILAASAR